MNRNLLILGAGQYGTVVKEIAEEMQCFEKIAFLDDTYGNEKADETYHEAAIGRLSDYEEQTPNYSYAIVAMGNPQLRREWTEKLVEVGFKIPVIVSPRAFVSPSAQLRYGAVIEPLAGVQANAVVGIGSFVSMGAVVNHNAFVGDYCHIDCNATVESGAFVSVGELVACGEVVHHAPLTFSVDREGIHAKKQPITPVGYYNFDDVM